MTNGSDDMEYEAERRNEQEAEKARQQRIRDRAPGRRMNGKARAGDIDGLYHRFVFFVVRSRPRPLFQLS